MQKSDLPIIELLPPREGQVLRKNGEAAVGIACGKASVAGSVSAASRWEIGSQRGGI